MERVFYGVFSDIKYTLKISEKSISRAEMLIKWGWGVDHTVVFYREFLNNLLFAFQKVFFSTTHVLQAIILTYPLIIFC